MTGDITTQDIVLSAALKCLGYKITRIEKDGNKGIFYFEEIPEQVITDYHLGRTLVEPGEFNMQIKALTTASRRLV
jgi:hypothetical protein